MTARSRLRILVIACVIIGVALAGTALLRFGDFLTTPLKTVHETPLDPADSWEPERRPAGMHELEEAIAHLSAGESLAAVRDSLQIRKTDYTKINLHGSEAEKLLREVNDDPAAGLKKYCGQRDEIVARLAAQKTMPEHHLAIRYRQSLEKAREQLEDFLRRVETPLKVQRQELKIARRLFMKNMDQDSREEAAVAGMRLMGTLAMARLCDLGLDTTDVLDARMSGKEVKPVPTVQILRRRSVE